MSDVPRPRQFVVPDHVISRHVGDETVILDLTNGTYFGLNTVGARVWELLQERATVPDVVVRLLDEFDVEEERLKADVDKLIETLARQGLISVES